MTDKPRRDPATVIKAVLAVVPDKHPALQERLARIAEDAWFQPPESPTPWIKLRDALTSYIDGGPTETWHFKVIDVVQTHPGLPEEGK
jgi:hypothetical protein